MDTNWPGNLAAPPVPLAAVTRVLASWRLGCLSAGAASALPSGFPVRRGVFVVEDEAPGTVIYVHWRPGDEADPALGPALDRATGGRGGALARTAEQRAGEGDRVVVASLAGGLTSLPLRRVWEHAHAQMEDAEAPHQPLDRPELTLLDWRRVPEPPPPPPEGARPPPADLERLARLVLPRCTSAFRQNGQWQLSRPAEAFWAGTRVTELTRNPGQVTVHMEVSLLGEPGAAPLPSDAAFPDAATYFGVASAGRATLYASLLWEAARALRARGVPLSYRGRAVADVRFCDGVYEHPEPVEFHFLRRLAEAEPTGDGAPAAVEHRVYDGSSHSWLELDLADGGPSVILEGTPAQLPGLMDAASGAAVAPTLALTRRPGKAEEEKEELGHRALRSVSLNSGEPVVPAAYWAEPRPGPQETLTAVAAAQLEVYDASARARLHRAFLRIVEGLIDSQLAQDL